MAQVDKTEIALNKVWSVSVSNSDAAKNIMCELRVARRKMLLVKLVKVMFLTLPRKGTTPKILKMKFPVHTSCPKQKRK